MLKIFPLSPERDQPSERDIDQLRRDVVRYQQAKHSTLAARALVSLAEALDSKEGSGSDLEAIESLVQAADLFDEGGIRMLGWEQRGKVVSRLCPSGDGQVVGAYTGHFTDAFLKKLVDEMLQFEIEMGTAKTQFGVRRYRDDEIVGVIERNRELGIGGRTVMGGESQIGV
ncbi:hypothetical protein A2V68_01690 [candidate division Kazan bacterium RBG_13_50_9]|uniref:Uncharacterized protein n=1 Tax=candidate division Kazan bacterium RBG_13_50_9 TaxID=1798535 RepID=A0A1F4NSN8_UNCK3|nr:MAG: hypothetical protein A2V68_01690 [candidate division Kazan bacterium RBG_13_50_9]